MRGDVFLGCNSPVGIPSFEVNIKTLVTDHILIFVIQRISPHLITHRFSVLENFRKLAALAAFRTFISDGLLGLFLLFKIIEPVFGASHVVFTSREPVITK